MSYSFFLLTRLIPIRLRDLPLGSMATFAVLVATAGVLVHQFLIPTLGQFELMGKFSQGAWLALVGGLIAVAAAGAYWLIFRPTARRQNVPSP